VSEVTMMFSLSNQLKGNECVNNDDNQLFSQFNQYRFSISWPRIIVNGTKINRKGIDYYNSLINELLANEIEPAVTMFHWDLPQYLRELGGFTNPLIIRYFEFYANVLFENFGDRVKIWMTFNEPLPYCISEYGDGRIGAMIHASGVGEYLCGHHILISHANVYHLYKQKFFEKQRGEIGISLSLNFFYHKDESVGKDFVQRSLNIVVRRFKNYVRKPVNYQKSYRTAGSSIQSSVKMAATPRKW
jgi:beta-glucosidase/6-phospho-beta-glucosidase/beta-galactosidase